MIGFVMIFKGDQIYHQEDVLQSIVDNEGMPTFEKILLSKTITLYNRIQNYL